MYVQESFMYDWGGGGVFQKKKNSVTHLLYITFKNTN